MLPLPTLQTFDAFLADQELDLEAVIVGGTALSLLGVIERQTQDVDVLAPRLPDAIIAAARAFAAEQRRAGHDLADGWFNNGPVQLDEVLPDGWRGRIQVVYAGRALTLSTLGRADLLKTKLFALCDRGTDIADCVALAPSTGELDEVVSWLQSQDTHPHWPEHVIATMDHLRRRLGHVV